jgi:hypothetical protein
MNLTQKQQLLNEIQNFEKADFEVAFTNRYKDTATIDSVQAGDYTVAELFALSKKSIIQLKNRLESEDWQVLPMTSNLNEYGNQNIQTLINSTRNYLMACQYPQAAQQIKALVYYEIINGFWAFPKKIELGIRESSLAKLEQRASLMMTHIEERQNNINKLIEEVNAVKDNLIAFQTEKTNSFQTLQRNQVASNQLYAEIEGVRTQANNQQNTINDITAQCNNILGKLRAEQDKALEQQQNIQQQQEEIQNANDQLKKGIDADSIKVKETYEATEKYKDEIAKMMGFIADGTLGHSFNKRKKIATWSSAFWIFVTAISLCALVGWIYAVFTYWPANTGNEWANIVINAIKSSPLAFLFGYSLKQISKSRNIKEEYAYREAVALTLTAYMEQLDKEENNDKKKLLLETVEKLYTKPILSTDEMKSPIKIDSKDFADLMGKLTDAISTIKK